MTGICDMSFVKDILWLALVLFGILYLSSLWCIHRVVVSLSASHQPNGSLWSLRCGIHLTSVDISVCYHMGSLYSQRRGSQGRGNSGCCSSYLMADVYNRSVSWVGRFSLLSRKAVVWRRGQKKPKLLKTWLKADLNFGDKICPKLPLYN